MNNKLEWIVKYGNQENQRIRVEYFPLSKSSVVVCGEYGIKKSGKTTYYVFSNAMYNSNYFIENFEDIVLETHKQINENIENYDLLEKLFTFVKEVDIDDGTGEKVIEKNKHEIFGELKDDVEYFEELKEEENKKGLK